MTTVLEQQLIETRHTIDAFEHLYWQAAGKDYQTGTKSYLLLEFEKKYKKEFLERMEEYNTINLWRNSNNCQKAIKKIPN